MLIRMPLKMRSIFPYISYLESGMLRCSFISLVLSGSKGDGIQADLDSLG